MAYVNIIGSNENSISVQLAGLDTSWNNGTRPVVWWIGSSYQGESSLSNGVSSGGNKTITGLSPATEYTITAEVFFSGKLLYTGSATGTTTGSTRPSKFYWTTAERALFNNYGTVANFSYTRWNAFIDYVTELHSYNKTLNSKIGSSFNGYPSTTTVQTLLTDGRMASSNKILTAKKFNNIRYCVGSLYSTGISNVYTNDIVLGSYFTKLESAANSFTK